MPGQGFGAVLFWGGSGTETLRIGSVPELSLSDPEIMITVDPDPILQMVKETKNSDKY